MVKVVRLGSVRIGLKFVRLLGLFYNRTFFVRTFLWRRMKVGHLKKVKKSLLHQTVAHDVTM